MLESQSWTRKEIAIALAATVFVLLLHGAIPFLMIPTLGQAIWSMGFSQSLVNGSLFDVYARDIGIPQPAAIAFGLSGAWPASLLIRAGLHPADAYAAIVAFWLAVAMYSAYWIARCFGATRSVALLAAVAWMSMPIIWAHAGYSMLSLGIALLAFYFMTALRLFLIVPEKTSVTIRDCALYFVAAIVAVFMDGYTFMMFAVGSSILLAYSFFTRPETWPTLIKVSIPLHAVSFGAAYFLFSKYIGKSNFEAHSIDFFRGWGLDLSFIAIPTSGVLWIPDLLGFGMARSEASYFGDASVWVTTFSLPVVILGLLSWWRARRQVKISTGILLVAVLSFYMALGPSLKVNSTKEESWQRSHSREQTVLMPPEFAVMPTGNAWLSENLPGFNVMRASYRWSALGVFALWLLLVIRLSRKEDAHRLPWLLGLLVLILLNLPDFQKTWRDTTGYRDMFQQIDDDLVSELKKHIQPGETVAFLPWGNDFIANYIAPKAGFRTFNIGGDKNLAAAWSNWPDKVRALGPGIDAVEAEAVLKTLLDGTTDVVVFPYFDMLWSPHAWPCGGHQSDADDEKFSCLDDKKQALQSVISDLGRSPYVTMMETPLYSAVRLRPEFAGESNRPALLRALLRGVQYPVALAQGAEGPASILAEGWYALEAHHVWSQKSAVLRLPVPAECETLRCEAVLKFAVFGASPQRPVSVIFDSSDQGTQWNRRIVAESGADIEMSVPLEGVDGVREIKIQVPDAISPQALTGSPDARVLGVALRQIDLLKH